MSNPGNDPQPNVVISVVISSYNGERYLAQTLDSVAQQEGVETEGKGNGIEVILIDDASTDSSPKIIEHYALVLRNKGFVVKAILHRQNKGSVRCYTEGASLARGKYFKILDHDDLLASKRALAEPVARMETLAATGVQVGAVFTKTQYIDAAGVVFGEKRFPFPFLPYEARDGLVPKKWGRFVLAFSPIYPFVHGSSVVRKQCWEELSAGPMARSSVGAFDVSLALRVMHSDTWRVVYLRFPSLQYRIHATNYTQTIGSRDTWTRILNGYYEEIYRKGLRLAAIKRWNWCVQSLKSSYHRIKGAEAFKSIGLFR